MHAHVHRPSLLSHGTDGSGSVRDICRRATQLEQLLHNCSNPPVNAALVSILISSYAHDVVPNGTDGFSFVLQVVVDREEGEELAFAEARLATTAAASEGLRFSFLLSRL